MSLEKFAERELEKIGAFSKEDDFYGGMTGKAVMELVKTFSNQGHSGMSASLVSSLFNKLVNFENLTPLTFEDDEWEKIDDNTFQNLRNSSVFKDIDENKPYNVGAYVLVNKKTGTSWGGSLLMEDGAKLKKCYIKSNELPKIRIELDIVENNDEWNFVPCKYEQLKELEKYYELSFHKK